MYSETHYENPEHTRVGGTYSQGGMFSGVDKNQHPEKWAEIHETGTPTDYVDPRTPQQIYDEEVLAPLDAQVLKDAARMVEDFYDALADQLPQSMKDERGPLMAERKAKRAARPK